MNTPRQCDCGETSNVAGMCDNDNCPGQMRDYREARAARKASMPKLPDTIDLRNMPWEELLPTLEPRSVDLLYTDPPFGMEFQSGARKEQHKKIANDDNLDWLNGWTDAIKRVMKDDSHMYIWCSWHKVDIFKQALERHWKIKNMLVWDTDVITKAYRTGNVWHPTQKSFELAQWILSKSSKEGDLILDTFSGSGSTAIACHKTRRRFVGSELDKDFYDASMRHIEIETSQIEMF